MQTVVTRILHGLAWLVLAGLVVEFYLAGAALFGGTTYQPHRALGAALTVAILLILVLALVARPGRRVVWLAVLLAALTVVQVTLPSFRTSLPWVAALHVVNAAVLLAVTVDIALATRGTTAKARSGPREPDASATAGGETY